MFSKAFLAVLLFAVLLVFTAEAAKKSKKEADPRECEVCVSNLEAIDKFIPSDKKKDTSEIESAINKHCTLSGFGSEWKPNPALTSPKDVKMCYLFQPIRKSISTPFAMGMPKKKVCERLKKDNPEVCEVKYPIKIEKKEGEKVDYGKMRVKQLKEILNQRGAQCQGCSEKSEFVKRCEDTEDMEL
jgi:hypothetical protein